MPDNSKIIYVHEIPVNFKRTKRKGAALAYKNEQFYLTASYFVPQFELDRFLEDKYVWMQKQLARPHKNVTIKWEEGSTVYILGEPKTLHMENSKRSSVEVTPEYLIVRGPSLNAMKGAYKKYVMGKMDEIIDSFRSEITYPVGDYLLSYRYYTSRWGCCNRKKRQINLNVWCYGLPLEGIRYVYCHELAHLKVGHHQKPFYDHLGEIWPDYRKGLKLTKDYIIS